MSAVGGAEEAQSQSGYEDCMGGPGAPTPLSALEVGCFSRSHASVQRLIFPQGVNGLSARDINLFIDAGYNTVESVAYT